MRAQLAPSPTWPLTSSFLLPVLPPATEHPDARHRRRTPRPHTPRRSPPAHRSAAHASRHASAAAWRSACRHTSGIGRRRRSRRPPEIVAHSRRPNRGRCTFCARPPAPGSSMRTRSASSFAPPFGARCATLRRSCPQPSRIPASSLDHVRQCIILRRLLRPECTVLLRQSSPIPSPCPPSDPYPHQPERQPNEHDAPCHDHQATHRLPSHATSARRAPS